jgi:hypothetical protein
LIITISHSVSGWSCRIHEDTANSFTITVVSDSNVTFFSPVSSPGVSDDPVVLTSLRAITNSCNGMIKIGLASLVVIDTSFIELPSWAGCIN